MIFVKKLGTWFYLLNKRLYKKVSFLVILFLIPVLVFALGIAAQEDSGFIRIALAQEDSDDPFATQLIDDLSSDSRLIYFVVHDSPESAISSVKHGKADGAWIFQANLQEKMLAFSASKSEKDAFVRVVEREETVPLRISHEKLSGFLYSYCSESLYLHFIETEVPQLNGLSDDELLEYYDAFFVNDNLFEFSYLDASESTKDAQTTSYLLTPIRGMLAILVLLCGLATSMYYLQDEQRGTFAWIPQHRKPFLELACQMISLLNVGIVMLLSLKLIRVTTFLGREFLMLVLFLIACALFCMIVRQLCKKLQIISTLIPLLTVTTIAVCPVFFDFKSLRVLQLLFPPTYYVNAVHNKKYLVYLICYILIASLIYTFLQCRRRSVVK